MKKYAHLRIKAREFRIKGMSLPDICKALQLPKTTVFYWVKDMPAIKRVSCTRNQQRATRAMCLKYELLRKKAYQQGVDEYQQLNKVHGFRDFIVSYLTEGTRSNRNAVGLVNTNVNIVRLAYTWIRQLSTHNVYLELHLYQDNDPSLCISFWATQLGIDPLTVRTYSTENRGGMKGRCRRLPYGTATVRTSDTYLRAKLQAWMDIVEQDWKSECSGIGTRPALGAGKFEGSSPSTPTL